jgi:hypothetical protein
MSSHQVSRRTLARGAAWTVPIVAVAVSAPAFAASPGSAPQVSILGGCRCGTGGGTTKPYRLDVTFTNATSSTFTITNPTITVSGTAGNNVTLLATTPAQTNQVPPGTKVLRYRFTRGSNPASDSVTFTWTATNNTTHEAFPDTTTANVTWGNCTVACVG